MIYACKYHLFVRRFFSFLYAQSIVHILGLNVTRTFLTIRWELHVNRVLLEEQAKESHVDDLWGQLTKLGSEINVVKFEQSYQKARMTAANDLAQQTQSRLKLYTVLRSVVMVAVSVGQALLIQRFFSNKLGSVGNALNRLGGAGGFVGGMGPPPPPSYGFSR